LRILLAGATGNMGTQTARHLLSATRHTLAFLVHRTPPARDLEGHPRVEARRGDLNDSASLRDACRGVDAILYSAGVLFRPFPGRFLGTTNDLYVRHLADAAVRCGVGRFLLASFPHVAGETTPGRPAPESLDLHPGAIHSATRLSAEKHLFQAARGTGLRPLVLRVGFVYGPEMRLVRGAKWLLERRLMAVWPGPTWVHLLFIEDYLEAVRRCLEDESLEGILNLGDDRPLTLQALLDRLADHWGCPRPRRLPPAMFRAAALITEVGTYALGLPCPLHRDLVRMGMTSCVADTRRMKRVLPGLPRFPDLESGLGRL
jgi:nucleoside-diphosphate-sugar epimerase